MTKSTQYFTNSKAVDKVLPEKVYGQNPPAGKEQTKLEVELFRKIPKYTQS